MTTGPSGATATPYIKHKGQETLGGVSALRNPYRERLAKRLAAQGGKHRPTTAKEDRLIMAEEDAVALMREAVALRGTIGNPF